MAAEKVQHELPLGHELHGTEVAHMVGLPEVHPAHVTLLLGQEVETLGAVLALECFQLSVLRLPAQTQIAQTHFFQVSPNVFNEEKPATGQAMGNPVPEIRKKRKEPRVVQHHVL